MREIERKFLVRKLPADLDQYRRTEIAQGYLALDPQGVEVRLRKANKSYCLTVKKREANGRDEHNVTLSKTQWNELWPLTKGRRLSKIRFDVPCENRIVELDIFLGLNNGLILAEVEFPSPESASAFQPPLWLGEEVTGIALYSNYHRAVE